MKAAEQQSSKAADRNGTSPEAPLRYGRLDESILERAEVFAHRVVDVAEALGREGRSYRITDQLIGAGTSVAANLFEAAEALSRADFCRILGICIRELSEARFWIRFIGKRDWLPASRLQALEDEAVQLRRILGSMLARTRRRDGKGGVQ